MMFSVYLVDGNNGNIAVCKENYINTSINGSSLFTRDVFFGPNLACEIFVFIRTQRPDVITTIEFISHSPFIHCTVQRNAKI